jgi:GT2 family glycosyltransferase
MFENPLVSVIILNFNGASLLEECISSVEKTVYAPLEIVVVDNNSTDGSLELLTSFPAVKVIRNKKNYGYAEGNNIGISQSNGKYFVTLNNDVTIEPDWLNKPVALLEENERIGAISCRQMSYHDKTRIDGLFHFFKPDLTLIPLGEGRLPDEDPRYRMTGRVFSVNGGSAVIRRKMFDEVGRFDARFFAYLDEVDLCMRAFLHGWWSVYVPEAVVYHKGSVSFKKTGVRKYFYRERNRFWFLYKYFPVSFIIKHLLPVVIMELRVVRVMCIKFFKPGWYLKARIEAIRGFREYRLERKENLRLLRSRWREFSELKKKRILPLNNT